MKLNLVMNECFIQSPVQNKQTKQRKKDSGMVVKIIEYQEEENDAFVNQKRDLV